MLSYLINSKLFTVTRLLFWLGPKTFALADINKTASLFIFRLLQNGLYTIIKLLLWFLLSWEKTQALLFKSFHLCFRPFLSPTSLQAMVCKECESLVSPVLDKPAPNIAAVTSEARRQWRCRTCGGTDSVGPITLPFVLRFLVAELAVMGINMTFKVRPGVWPPPEGFSASPVSWPLWRSSARIPVTRDCLVSG